MFTFRRRRKEEEEVVEVGEEEGEERGGEEKLNFRLKLKQCRKANREEFGVIFTLSKCLFS